MGTPTSVKYSRVPGTPEEALSRLDEQLLSAMRLEYESFGALQPSDSAWDQGFKLVGGMVPCRSRAEALNLARAQTAWGISFLSRQVPGNVDFYAVDIGETSFGTRLTLESSMPYYKNDELPMGEWLVKLLLAAVSALGCDLCGYGADDAYEAGYDSLDPSVVLARLRAGELFKIRSPQFHAIATKLISEEEMRALLEQHPKDPTFVYKVSTGTPTSVKYSRVPGTPEEALARFDEQLLPTMGLKYADFGALEPSDRPNDQGLKLVNRSVPCRSRDEALALARPWQAWGVSFLSKEARGNVDLCFFAIAKDSFGARLTVESSMPYYESDESPKGEWLVKLLLSAVSALGCKVCGYGTDDAYEDGYDALDPTVVLGRLRAGELFAIRRPQFHAISSELISQDEMTTLLDRYPKAPRLQYKLSTTGYHLLYAVG